MILSHSIRLVPNEAQEAYFRRACGTTRFTYNWALAEWKRQYGTGGKPKASELKKQFNDCKRTEFPWTYKVHRDCTSQPFTNIQSAFNNFFRRLKTKKGKAGFPRFKHKGEHDSFYCANDKIRLEGKRVRLPVLGWVKLREELRFIGKILSATVSRRANRWMLSVQVDVGDYTRKANEKRTQVIGVDLGVKHLAVLSTGEKIEGPKALQVNLKKLRRASRWMSRKVKGSRNRFKAKCKLARLYLRISDVRLDAIHKLTNQLCRENQAVVIEDLAVANMVKMKSLSRKISDQGFGEIRRQLAYKAAIYVTSIIIADRFFPSSKICSSCGAVKPVLLLSEREFACECGVIKDRDVNAAKNLEQLPWATGEVTPVEIEALTGLKVDPVKLRSMKQESPSAQQHLESSS